MAVSEEYLAYIIEMLEGVGQLTHQRMFGGALFKVDGKQLGVVLDEELYFKVTEQSLQQRFAEEGGVRFTYTRKDTKDPVVIKNWWKIPEQYLDDATLLLQLAQKVLMQENTA